VNPRNFFAELKRRHVYKVAVAYAVVGWLLIQVATQVFPFFEIPNWGVRLIVLIIIAGFPIALVLAWAFELTPEGIQRSESAEGKVQHSPSRTWIYVVLVAGVLSVALFFLGRFTAPVTRERGESAASTQGTPTEISSKSIAVLPFENLSANQENAFFTDGVQDEILTDLAKVADLKVISRTSVMQYKAAAPRNLSEIAQALKVANVLEGSVQRSANRVRVSAQLIDARTDTHIWAENYDRDLSDVFAIQSEIAQAIADQLQAKLSPKEKAAIDKRPTNDLTAYDLYLKAEQLRDEDIANQSYVRNGILEAIRLLNEAVARDPHFLLAYCLLAHAHDALYANFEQTDERLALAEASVKAAVKLQPDAGETHLAKGRHYYLGYLDYGRAREELLQAQRALPNNAEVSEFLGRIDRRQGRWDDAVRNMVRAVELDPLNVLPLENLGEVYINLRHYREAAQVYDRALVLHPASPSARILRASVDFHATANLAPARAVLNAVEKDDPKAAAELVEGAFIVALWERDPVAAERAVAEMSGEARENLLFPTAFYEGRVALLRHDAAAKRAAFLAARAQMERLVLAQPKNSEPLGILAWVDAFLGDKDKAIQKARAACAMTPLSKDAVEGAQRKTILARVYTLTGERQLALEELTTLSKLPGGPSYGELMLDPEWDSLRSDPEFQKIVASLAPKRKEEYLKK